MLHSLYYNYETLSPYNAGTGEKDHIHVGGLACEHGWEDKNSFNEHHSCDLTIKTAKILWHWVYHSNIFS